MNFITQGLPLGRWLGIRVILHWSFLLIAGLWISTSDQRGYTAFLLALLFGTVVMHEFGHALSCRAVGGEAPLIVLTPLGGLAFVQPPMKAWAWLVTTVCGPLVNAILWPAAYYASKFLIERHYGADPWAELVRASNKGFVFAPETTIGEQICIMMWQINRMLLLFNLLPAYPMDGGRILQELLWMTVGYRRSLHIAGMVGTVAGIGFVVLGLGIRQIVLPVVNLPLGSEHGEWDFVLIAIGAMCAMASWGIYRRSLEISGWQKR